ncbi:ABC transporter permease [Actinoallomurus bryophytorum]|uniref:Peptide/nickel transport system permease protein/oligopeptide transport system permease protein n=1 Tax=Actinoallomurus bryophytorum TaxID=1490222 RepID=A0A543CF45_9ACTN|nr:ABC transporter permease [Actinoallomurus bryophytorum]TQL95728.1 peptide/nickel transport system permease protein/oligopeptide transport system permease protein [Actinoallomurus bryophytorum]
MWRYVVRRLLQMVPVLIGTTLLIYLAVFALPGDPIRVLGGDKPMPPSVYEALRHHYHLDQPLIVQYGQYLWGLVHGDFGETLTGQPVSDVMKADWAVTARLAVTAWIFELVIGIALGVWAGRRKGGIADTVVLSGTTLIIAIPVFVLAYSAQLLFGLKLGWFPTAGIDDGWPYSYLLPGIVLGSTSLAYIARLTRTSLVENSRADYVRTAVAKGLTRRRVLIRHTLRNSLIPVITFLGVDLGSLMAGAIVIEGIFNLPGIGGQIYTAIQIKDGPTVVGIATLLVLVYLFANLAVDVLYGVLDPRIRYE